MIAGPKRPDAFGCFDAAIEPSHMHPGQPIGLWLNLDEGGTRYRYLAAPVPARIPAATIQVLTKWRPMGQCHHKLAFEPPDFVALDQQGRISRIAIVNFHDLCPICGGGYVIQFEWSGGRWVPEPSGIRGTWIS